MGLCGHPLGGGEMKRTQLLIILIFGISLVGCAWIGRQKANFDSCIADTECKAQAEGWKSRVETASVIVASAVPVPGAAAAPKILGYLALGLAAIIGGSRLKKEETPK